MSFWKTSTGETATDTGKDFEVAGSNFDPIPEGSNLLAMIEEVKWETVRDGIEEFINAKWVVLKPEEFANRKVFQKLFVDDLDPSEKDKEKAAKKKDRALRMLSAIDANSGGKLAGIDTRPTNDQLTRALTNKPMVIGLGVWESNGKSGNWVRAIADKSKAVSVGTAKASKPTTNFKDDLDGDLVPF